MSRSLFAIAALLFLGLFGLAAPVSAQSELLFGQKHYYSTVFRGNGETIVYAKLILPNTSESPMREFSFELPRAAASEMVMYQMTLPQECARWDYVSGNRTCAEYREPSYSQQHYGSGAAQYKKIDFTVSGNQYRLTLPVMVAPNSFTALIIAYAAKGYVSERFGVFTFNFETLKVPTRIQELSVAVDTDSDLLLKGKPSSVNYTTLGIGTSGIVSPPSVEGSAPREFDMLVGKIGRSGPVIKTAKNLAPNESFTVRGEYARTWWQLHLGSLLIAGSVVGVLLLAAYGISRLVRRKGPQMNVNPQTVPVPAEPGAHLSILAASIVSLVSAGMVLGFTFVLKILEGEGVLRQFVGRDLVTSLLFIVIVFFTYTLLLIGPAIGVAVRRGWRALLMVLVGELFWLVLLIALYMTLFRT